MCPCLYLSLECELSCKLHREGLPEGQDVTKGAVFSSLGEKVEKHGKHTHHSHECNLDVFASYSI